MVVAVAEKEIPLRQLPVLEAALGALAEAEAAHRKTRPARQTVLLAEEMEGAILGSIPACLAAAVRVSEVGYSYRI